MKGIGFILTSILYLVPTILLVVKTYPKVKPMLKSFRYDLIYYSAIGIITVIYLIIFGQITQALPIDSFFGSTIFILYLFAIYLTTPCILFALILWSIDYFKRLIVKHSTKHNS